MPIGPAADLCAHTEHYCYAENRSRSGRLPLLTASVPYRLVW